MAETGGRVVAVTLPDLIALATFLERPTDAASLRRAVEQLVDHYCSLSPYTGTYMLTSTGDSGAHRAASGRPGDCPFLGADGRCEVYTVRPLLCRIFYHCDWLGDRLTWDTQLDSQVVNAVLELALAMGNLWRGHSGLLWCQPWRYDRIPLKAPALRASAHR